MYTIKLLNKISPVGLSELNPTKYTIDQEAEKPDAILVRSFKMHDMDLPDSVLAVARAGAGVNNIPIDEYAKRGVVVFNTPGGNANAVKELAVCSMLLASRKITDGIAWVKGLEGDDIAAQVEKGKASFIGPEIMGKKLGVIGLGAVGAQVANIAFSLGMEVYGYDPYISVDAAWSLSRAVKKAKTLKTIYDECDYISLHIPLTPDTKGMINSEVLSSIKRGVRIINLSRGELVNNDDMKEALENGQVSCYVTDFPNAETIGMKNTISIPHLGASTPESEDNCAAMAARQVVDFLENGIIKNSVNFPTVDEPKVSKTRVVLLHQNIPGVITQASSAFSELGYNIDHMTNKSRKEYAVTLLDTNDEVSDETVKRLKSVTGMISVRVIR